MRRAFIWAPTRTRSPLSAAGKHFSSSARLRRFFQEGDVVLLRDKKDAAHEGVLAKLSTSKTLVTHRGSFRHDDIIGKQPRQLVNSSKGFAYRIHEPTLAEYVRLTPRLVTPIYPSDANLIVSLLDLHVEQPAATPEHASPLEILEVGTGHGALTLHLSRAIHAANPPPPPSPPSALGQESEDDVHLGNSLSDSHDSKLESWRSGRRAIVHTLDISRKHSKHAKKIVQGFRHGIYAGNVDFHTGDVSAWIALQAESRQTDQPFLSHVFLDIPDADHHLANIASALRVDGFLAVFNPSISQIAGCVETIRARRLPFLLDQVVELGANTVRQWDVRAVKPRATLRRAAEDRLDDASEIEPAVDHDQAHPGRGEELAQEVGRHEEKWAMICRPKVGERVIGGGFLGLWRKMEPPPEGEVDREGAL
ncbi:S-adenosyl-L-methionine-dependent methyltransferase [Polyplosphaeria fusca]|uniref:tRNA (adenine(58)-N(1))-methyltransferase catalytic subunit TRM61 n=1 Tax=Polyplosphaeria fusca TaxID=682080 RepID=A0A9P4V9F5_9PLEO|nr:S-adenosyl-L-methionine-dependent methyltransferase [Polyplosphaeria fusca]